MSIQDVVRLKHEGNKLFRQNEFVQACLSYAKAVETMIEIESLELHHHIAEEFLCLKSQLFLNLGIANFKLNEIEGCRKCCNTSLVFCKNPLLPLESLGLDDDLNIDVDMTGVAIEQSQKTNAAKALYRRGICKRILGDIENALVDYRIALQLLPDDKTIGQAITEITSATQSCSDSDITSDINVFHRLPSPLIVDMPEIHYMTVNGAACLLKKGFFSQTPSDATVYLNLFSLLECKILSQNKVGWNVVFTSNAISISHGPSGFFLVEQLEYNIKYKECIWSIESSSSNDAVLFLVMHLTKAEPFERFPGCEWWDRVFQSDEPIDTLTCSISTDVCTLPEHAAIRAQQEHYRFMALSEQEKAAELCQLASYKKAFMRAEESVRESSQLEENAISDVPERAEMLTRMREAFPHIDFTAR